MRFSLSAISVKFTMYPFLFQAGMAPLTIGFLNFTGTPFRCSPIEGLQKDMSDADDIDITKPLVAYPALFNNEIESTDNFFHSD